MAGITSDLAKKSGDHPRVVVGPFQPGQHCLSTWYILSNEDKIATELRISHRKSFKSSPGVHSFYKQNLKFGH